jgi:hypothetical protein
LEMALSARHPRRSAPGVRHHHVAEAHDERRNAEHARVLRGFDGNVLPALRIAHAAGIGVTVGEEENVFSARGTRAESVERRRDSIQRVPGRRLPSESAPVNGAHRASALRTERCVDDIDPGTVVERRLDRCGAHRTNGFDLGAARICLGHADVVRPAEAR